jgi:hypothetical protein
MVIRPLNEFTLLPARTAAAAYAVIAEHPLPQQVGLRATVAASSFGE